ncbi:MAG: hypothetical protein XXXJIFNMEKO3_02301 [Candidatus Erwinia impunctatus]|nr:hypothetical protein XXXJIFNMEKO_02301 [Culicoides impunctatus]
MKTSSEGILILEPVQVDEKELIELPAFQRVAHTLRENIINGTLRPQQPLQEAELSAACGTSRNTLREALRSLHAEGLVVYHQHRGVSVRRMDRGDLRDIYRVRRHLELLALDVGLPLNPFHRAKMASLIQQAEQAEQDQSWRASGTLSLRFHQAVVCLLGSRRLNDFFAVIIAQLRLLFASGAAERDFQQPWLARDRELYQLLLTESHREARDYLASYLDHSEQLLLQMFIQPSYLQEYY